MTEFGLEKEDIDLIIRSVKKFSDVNEAIIFGSRAMGNYKPASDIDIALKGDLQFGTTGSISTFLNDEAPAFPYKVDVINYDLISNVELKKHIDTLGKSIYKKESLQTPPGENAAG